MAFIGIKVPPEVAAQLSSIRAPGKAVGQEEMHITVLYLGKEMSAYHVLSAAMGCHTVAARWKPFLVHAAALMCFPENPEDGVPVIARVVSTELQKFREEIRIAMDKMSVPYSNKYPEYKPHVTLAYAPAGSAGPAPEKIGPFSWAVKEITVWGGREMTDGIRTTLSLEG
jgi:2'-5' RNA ligase